MRNLQELLEKSTIIFPKSLDVNQIEDFFEYLAEYLIEINYQIEMRGTMSKNDPEKLFKQKYCSNISGRMTDISSIGYASSEFKCTIEESEDLNENDYFTKFDGLKFSTIPGYSLKEHREEEVSLWKRVRNITEGYFSLKECIVTLKGAN